MPNILYMDGGGGGGQIQIKFPIKYNNTVLIAMDHIKMENIPQLKAKVAY